jgi:hypothetical protein
MKKIKNSLICLDAQNRADTRFDEFFEFGQIYQEEPLLLKLNEIQINEIQKFETSDIFQNAEETSKFWKISVPLACIFVSFLFPKNIYAISIIELIKFNKDRTWYQWSKEFADYGYGYGIDEEVLVRLATTTAGLALSVGGIFISENYFVRKLPVSFMRNVNMPQIIEKYNLPLLINLPEIPKFIEKEKFVVPRLIGKIAVDFSKIDWSD